MANFRRRKNIYANGNGVSGRKSRRRSADRISQNPMQGMRQFDASSEVMNGFSGYNDDYNGFNSSSSRGIVWSGAAGNQGAAQPQRAAKPERAAKPVVGKKSQRSSADRIAAKPVMGKAKPQAGAPPQRESGACQPTKCGHYNNATCPAGCSCSSTYNGICKKSGGIAGGGAKVKQGQMKLSASGRKSRRGSMDRLSINPVRGRANFRGFNASGCGNYI